jgi:hypothetical protein
LRGAVKAIQPRPDIADGGTAKHACQDVVPAARKQRLRRRCQQRCRQQKKSRRPLTSVATHHPPTAIATGEKDKPYGNIDFSQSNPTPAPKQQRKHMLAYRAGKMPARPR